MDYQVLTNHVGYVAEDPKVALLQAKGHEEPVRFWVKTPEGEVLYEGKPVPQGAIAHWQTGNYWTLDFSPVQTSAQVYIEVQLPSRTVCSQWFPIQGKERDMRLINAGVCYFKSQRATGEWDAADRRAVFRDGYREGCMDVHGGWWDASGDVSKHLSHLSHSGWCNPQQTALSAYALFSLFDVLACDEQYGIMRRRILDEACYGADFLMRMRAPSGSFFRSVSRRESYRPVSDNRAIQHEFRRSSGQFEQGFKAPTEGQEQVTDEYYEVSMRSGGGSAIAALAIAARHPYAGCDYHTEEYLFAAKAAYRYLVRENARYTNDGAWNFVDTYCMLLAATELYKTSGEIGYLQDARSAADKMIQGMEHYLDDDHAWFSREEHEPFYHAADEGLPMVALATLCEVEPDMDRKYHYQQALKEAMAHKLRLSTGNAFHYPKYVMKEQGALVQRFFFSHHTPAVPWWQGDNARICSLATAMLMTGWVTGDREICEDAMCAAHHITDWILGLNPFDACMMEGYGRNNILYSFEGRYDFLAFPGGIVNGITSAMDDEEGICFCTHPGEGNDITDNWRWAEQWIPHCTWFLLAMGYMQKVRKML